MYTQEGTCDFDNLEEREREREMWRGVQSTDTKGGEREIDPRKTPR